jgi:hypothetical protein
MKTLQEAVERETAKEVYDKANVIMQILSNKLETKNDGEKIYPTVKGVPPLKSKNLEMTLYNKDLIIKKCIETFEDGNGHSTIDIFYKNPIPFIPIIYIKKHVFSAERVHQSSYIRTNILENGYWKFCLDDILKKSNK